MRLSPVTRLFLASMAASAVSSYPGMDGKLISRLQSHHARDGATGELLGDLATLPDGKLTPVGKDLKALLTGSGTPESSEAWAGEVPALDSPRCRHDTCCIWKHIADTMRAAFLGPTGKCNDMARYAVRLGFHDAGGWSKPTAAQGGGADGSILLSPDEIDRHENLGLDDIADKMHDWYDHYHTELKYPVSMADLIQMGATVAAVTCPLGPRVRSFVGRPDSTKSAPQLLPDVNADADSLLALFADKTIGPADLAALLGAHTTSMQEFVDVKKELAPQDSTPGVWDTVFYNETLGASGGCAEPPARVMRFASDVVLAAHPAVAPTWHRFAAPNAQVSWNTAYARAYIRLSLLGVDSPNSLTECTKVLPAVTLSYTDPDAKEMEKWLKDDDWTSTRNNKTTTEISKAESFTW